MLEASDHDAGMHPDRSGEGSDVVKSLQSGQMGSLTRGYEEVLGEPISLPILG